MLVLLSVVLPALLTSAQQILSVHLSPPPPASQNAGFDFSAGAALARFLNLEAYEAFPGKGLVMQQEAFIGEALDSAKTTIVVYTDNAHDIVSANTKQQSFPLAVTSSADELMTLYLSRALDTYATVYTSLPSTLPVTGNNFIVLSLTTPESKESLRSFLSLNPDTNLAILTPSASSFHKRDESDIQQQPPSQSPFPLPAPHQPIAGISTCHSSLSICTNSTNSCSGHGECALARKGSLRCYVCTCGATVEGEGKSKRTTTWAGGMCQKKDYSGDFALLAGTTLALFIFVAASITLLVSVGSVELPSVLIASASGGKS